ncbi:MAG: hypothetical protein IKP96_01460 [Elusimicrobiaceae bacterium]|nr:hypothetical protein [Elusimicrobiaceae bacterium]
MKKFFFLLLVMMLIVTVQGVAAPNAAVAGSRRVEIMRRYVQKMPSAQALFLAAQEGNVEAIGTLTRADFLQATDKFGNNCFHLAKNADTVQALAAAVRRLEKDPTAVINHLRNQRNNMGETPLMYHVNYGKADAFRLLYEGTELAAAVREVSRVDKGGALKHSADIKKGVALAVSRDNSGRTVAQAALANIDKPGMQSIVNFFERTAPYLL